MRKAAFAAFFIIILSVKLTVTTVTAVILSTLFRIIGSR